MKKIRFTDISWDLSELSPEEKEEVLETLPESPILIAPDDFEPETEGADLLSDEYGYCVENFGFEILCSSTTSSGSSAVNQGTSS